MSIETVALNMCIYALTAWGSGFAIGLLFGALKRVIDHL